MTDGAITPGERIGATGSPRRRPRTLHATRARAGPSRPRPGGAEPHGGCADRRRRRRRRRGLARGPGNRPRGATGAGAGRLAGSRGDPVRHPRAVQPPGPDTALCARPSPRPGSPGWWPAVRDPNPLVDGRGSDSCGRPASRWPRASSRKSAPTWSLGSRPTFRPGCRSSRSRWRRRSTARRPRGTDRPAGSPARRPGRTFIRLARSGAVVVGAGTAAADDPSLTVRLAGYGAGTASGAGRRPGPDPGDRRDVRRCRTHPGHDDDPAPRRGSGAWAVRGADVLCSRPDRDGGVPLAALMATLGKREVQEVLLEGGPTLAWSAVRDGLVDRFVLYLASKLAGGRDAPGHPRRATASVIAIALRADRVGGADGRGPASRGEPRSEGRDDVHGDR